MSDFFLPRSLDDLWAALRQAPEAPIYAGGTDFLVRLRQTPVRPPALICIERMDALQTIEEGRDEVRIGACVTHAGLMASPVIRRHFPVLAEAARHLGSPQIRNMGTIGGNIVSASPAGDTLPPLYVLDAQVELRRADHVRRLPVSGFIRGPGQTTLQPGEILTAVRIRKQPGLTVHHFEKVGRRDALAIAVVSLAAGIGLSKEGKVTRVRLAWGSVGPTVMIVPEAEKRLVGRPLETNSLMAAAEAVRRTLVPIDDVRAGADYRRQVAGNLLLRLAGRMETETGR